MVFVVVHLTIAAVWLGSMAYSLIVVQPRVARFFPDVEQREGFLVALAHGNRWRVVGLICALLVTDALVMVAQPAARAWYGLALGPYLIASAIFSYVSWRHWPARIFALPQELPGYQRRLRLLAWSMLGLVAVAFLTTLAASITAGR
ncbi:hypothetical protein [Actinoallomurus sp. NPDC050550]|uniref:hypothetical protein n=1 Tax=Actinoallomurus sp. NPDC050550 TaxID=3154937 RepID=UPI0033CC492C